MLPATYSPLGALEDNLPIWEWKSKGNIPYYFLPLASYKYLSFFLQLEMACVLNSLMIVFRYHTSLLIIWDGSKSALGLICFGLVEIFLGNVLVWKQTVEIQQAIGVHSSLIRVLCNWRLSLSVYGKGCWAVKFCWSVFSTNCVMKKD